MGKAIGVMLLPFSNLRKSIQPFTITYGKGGLVIDAF
jgi:hypothetical protein